MQRALRDFGLIGCVGCQEFRPPGYRARGFWHLMVVEAASGETYVNPGVAPPKGVEETPHLLLAYLAVEAVWLFYDQLRRYVGIEVA